MSSRIPPPPPTHTCETLKCKILTETTPTVALTRVLLSLGGGFVAQSSLILHQFCSPLGYALYIQDEFVQVMYHLGIHMYGLVTKVHMQKMFWSAIVLAAYYVLFILQSTATVFNHSFGSR